MASVDITGEPGSQELPISMTMEPSFVSIFLNSGPNAHNQATYSSPVSLPYRFFVFNGKGGEVKIKLIFPSYWSRAPEVSNSLDFAPYMRPRWVLYATLPGVLPRNGFATFFL